MIGFSTKFKTSSDAFALFVDDKFSYEDRKNCLPKSLKLKVDAFIKVIKGSKLENKIFSFDISEKTKCFLIKYTKKEKYNYFEDIGANFFSYQGNFKNINKIDLYVDSLNKEKVKIIDFITKFLHGFNLKSYSFNKYKTSNIKKKKVDLNLITSSKGEINNQYKYFDSLEKGVFLTRDLVSEPPNILNPEKYVQEIKKLSKLGLKISVYNEAKMKKMGMNAILGVGEGSTKESYLVVIEWFGKKNSKSNPLAFVGKGVCFDTGGISLKPARFMEEMKYDMAGSAVVVGLLKTLALRKAKVNAVGVVGLVENMPGGNAQRPGDIVKSFSGKTIEILNTDAEGRLVLADALSFTEKKFKPKFIIDLATLTGAIIVSLGDEYAGMFSNDNDLAKKVFDSGNDVGEKVWRFPLHKNYDKLMDSKVADVQNINYAGGAGSITAAQFLQRFILNKTPWVHLDIAGMAFLKKGASLNPEGATGFGVRLLNSLIKKNYE